MIALTKKQRNDIIIYHLGDNERRVKKMALTEAQKRAKAKYKAAKVKKILVEFYSADAELWDKLQEQQNKQGYIKELIRKDIK